MTVCIPTDEPPSLLSTHRLSHSAAEPALGRAN
jgi:hypothetical protein